MIKLDKWQEEVLNYEGDILLCTGRRVGKTYILARKAIDLMARKPKTPIVIVSLTEDQAIIILSMALNYAKEKYPHLIGVEKDKPKMKELTLNGGKMTVRPVGNTGDGARGFEGGVLIVDEASRVPKMFWIAAKPILLTTNGQLWLGSTPFGTQGYFWERYNETVNKKLPNARFRVFQISTDEMVRNREISESWTEEQRAGAIRILEKDREEMSGREWMQEYGGKFISELNQYFPDDLIDNCTKLKRHEIRHEFKSYLGVDVARMGDDEITYEIVQKLDKNKFEHVESVTEKKKFFYETIDKILEFERVWNFKLIGIDDGGIGVGVFDPLLKNEATKRKVVAINNRKRSLDREDKSKKKLHKEDLYNNFIVMLQRGELMLLDSEELRVSLRSVQYEYITGDDKQGKMNIFSSPHSASHIIEGLIRAAWLAAEDKSLNPFCYY